MCLLKIEPYYSRNFYFTVWGVAMGIIVMNDSYGIGDFKKWAFEDSTWFAKYLTHVTMFWINSR